MRDYIVIGSMIVVVAVVGIALFYFGPPSLKSDMNTAISSTESTSTIPYVVLSEGTSTASIDDRANYQITTANDLTTLWQMVYGKSGTVPSIDFSKYDVLGVFDGLHSTTDYGVQVASVVEAGGKRIVVITHMIPGKNCIPADKPTSPFELISVSKTTLPLTHIDMSSTTPCS
jgi:hypothetical protein